MSLTRKLKARIVEVVKAPGTQLHHVGQVVQRETKRRMIVLRTTTTRNPDKKLPQNLMLWRISSILSILYIKVRHKSSLKKEELFLTKNLKLL